jgi:hypothetical protein
LPHSATVVDSPAVLLVATGHPDFRLPEVQSPLCHSTFICGEPNLAPHTAAIAKSWSSHSVDRREKTSSGIRRKINQHDDALRQSTGSVVELKAVRHLRS